MEIVYRHTYDEKRENRYEVEPYGLKAFRRRWYLIADSVEMGGIYAFALDRVRSMVPTAKAAEIPSDFDCAEFYADAFGIIRERTGRPNGSKSASWGSRRTTSEPCPCTLPSVKPNGPRNIRCSNTGWLRPTISEWNCSRTARTWRYCAPRGSGKR